MRFRIRASAAGQIVKKPRSGSGLSETAKTYVEQWYKEKLYGRTKQFSSKYTDKGNAVESDAIRYLSKLRGVEYVKNDQTFQNDLMIGTPDIITPDRIIDVKCSWDCFSFPLFDTELPTDDYYYQMQVYMELTGVNRAEVVYLLMDAPEDMIDREALIEARRQGMAEIEMELFDQVRDRMTYSGLSDSLRVKSFQIERDKDCIERIRERVELCNEYLNSIVINTPTL